MQPLIRKRIGEEHTREKQDLRAFVTFVAFSRHGMHLILYCTRFNRQIFHTRHTETLKSVLLPLKMPDFLLSLLLNRYSHKILDILSNLSKLNFDN